MITRLALRSLATRPLRTIVLAVGFGLGVAVMAILLGVGEVVLQEAQSPALQGGGDIVVSGAAGAIDNARFAAASVISQAQTGGQVVAASPWKRASIYLMMPRQPWQVQARGGVPSLERGIGDREIAGVPGWVDEPGDRRWTSAAPGELLRAMDRFHAIPDLPEFAGSWAEWLYFNARAADGRTSFYLTFMVGPRSSPGRRRASVRLQLQRDEESANFSAAADIDEASVLAHAPDLDIGGNQVRLVGSQYQIALQLRREGAGDPFTGTLTLDPDPGRSVPPLTMRGARGWVSGYTVPVLSGAMRGTLDGRAIALIGYHDHNWGFWDGVRWQWGQVAHDNLSFVYGRVFPPAAVAESERVPGFLGVLGPEGVIGVATRVSIAERGEDGGGRGAPRQVDIAARGTDLDLRLAFTVERSIRTPFGLTGSELPLDFLQLAGTYHVSGRAAGRSIDFTSRGAAETFR
ncbi:MAG TPA: hypothetical protein VH417_16260 [Vicinamibacterales bacterium]|jgi:hypothetical protein